MSRMSAWEVAWELARERRSPPWAAAGQAPRCEKQKFDRKGRACNFCYESPHKLACALRA